tara:strand:- start:5636 stop:7996 length:2361 start_codon:yes stop_codon:yes gene_type:complete
MKKILFFLIIFLSLNNTPSYITHAKPNTIKTFCDDKINQNQLKNIDNLKIKKIEIDTNDYRKWTINSIRIITNKYRFTPQKFKRRFKGKILVTYENNIQCNFKGRIRHSGDAKDHISLHGNSIIQSLDIHLEEGHIKGITKFKLYKPDTRGNLQDEILQTEILRNLDYLAPRTIKVSARINQTHSDMLFQEKAAKELLEFNNRREGPILEGDQKFFFKLVENIPDNQLSNWSVGMPELRSKSIKTMLAKQSNPTIIFKSENHKIMSYKALSNLNLIYLYYSNKFQDQKNNFNFFDYDLDNNLLGFFNSKNILKLDIYNLLLQATNSQHGLSVSNRKFYWNSIENYFEPINYDSNPGINRQLPTTTTTVARLPISKEFYKAFDALEKKLNNLNLNKIHKNIILSGINLTKNDLNKKINKILFNLDELKKNYLSLSNELVEHNKFRSINNDIILARFNNTLNEIDPSVFLVKFDQDSGQFQRCKIYLKNCENYSFSKENILNLLEGEFSLDAKMYQYLGNNLDFKSIINHKKYNQVKFKKATIFYDDGIELNNNLDKNILNIYQKKPGARIYIINGILENLTINFDGYKTVENGEETKLKVFPNYPIDINGLTGCLSLINLKVKNVSIDTNRSSCEDAINFINVEGSFDKINIKNSFSDGLDVDFSKIEIKNVEVFSSGNDCVDFSFGNYKLNKLNLENCGDKGLSVGEKSFLTLDKINVNKANTGIAIKDSSDATIKNINIKNTLKCISVYRKKQEFSGAIVNLKFVNCHDAEIENQAGSFITRETL